MRRDVESRDLSAAENPTEASHTCSKTLSTTPNKGQDLPLDEMVLARGGEREKDPQGPYCTLFFTVSGGQICRDHQTASPQSTSRVKLFA